MLDSYQALFKISIHDHTNTTNTPLSTFQDALAGRCDVVLFLCKYTDSLDKETIDSACMTNDQLLQFQSMIVSIYVYLNCENFEKSSRPGLPVFSSQARSSSDN